MSAWHASGHRIREPRGPRYSRPCWSGSPTPTRRPATRSPGSTPAAAAPDLLTVVGALLGAQPGESLRLTGRWGVPSAVRPPVRRRELHHGAAGHHPGHPALPGLRADQGHRPGDGRADRRATSAPTSCGVIEKEPERLIEVPGLGPKRTKMIAAAWEEQKAIKEVMVFLQGVGVSTSLAVRIYKKYGDASISVVRNEPTGWPRTSGASASRPPTPSLAASASRTTARSG